MAASETEEFEFRLRAEREAAAAPPAPPRGEKATEPSPPPPEPQAPAAGKGALQRGLEFTSGNIGEAIAGIVGLPVDTVLNIADMLKAGAGVAAGATGRGAEAMPELTERGQVLGSSQQLSDLMHRLGVISPEATPTTPGGRLAAMGIQGAAGAAMGGGRATPAGLGRAAAGGAAGGLAAGAAGAAGLDPAYQQLAGVLPSAARQAGRAPVEAVRRRLTAGEDVRANVEEARRAGLMTPDPAAVSGSRALAGAQGTLARLPGAGAIMDEAAEARTAQIGQRVQDLARELAPRGPVSAEQAGRLVTSGVNSAVEQFRSTQDRLYQQVDAQVPPETPIKVNNLRATLRRLAGTTKGAEATSKALVSDTISRYLSGLEEDLAKPQPGTSAYTGVGVPAAPRDALPYEALAGLRSQVGRRLEDGLLLTDAPKAEYKAIYKALSEDIRSSLSPEQRKTWDRASNYTRAGHDRIETVYQPLVDKATPEKALKAAFSGTKEGASAFRKIMGILTPDQRNAVGAHIIEKMGMAPAGAQAAGGGRFDANAFFRKWQELDPAAQRALFPSARTREDIATVQRVIGRMKDVGRGTYNPSGTARAVTHAGFAGAGLVTVTELLLRGHPGLAAATAGAMGTEALAANRVARAMTSPEFIRWLAEGTKIPETDVTRYATRLAVIARNTKDPETRAAIEDIGSYIGLPAPTGAK